MTTGRYVEASLNADARSSAYDRLVAALESHGSTVHTKGITATAQCPAHDDRSPSLGLSRSKDCVLVYCRAGCQTVDVLAELNLTLRDLYDEPKGSRLATYTYDDGRRVHRLQPGSDGKKRFSQSGNTKGTGQLYQLAAVKNAVADGATIYLVEGEKDADALESLGPVATTAAMGAGKWSKVDSTPLHGGRIVVIADRDEPGIRHAREVVQSLEGKVASLQVAHAKVGKDAADHIAAGHSLDDLVPLELPTVLILPPPTDPMAVARKIIENYITDELLTLQHWRGGWMRWQDTCWVEVEAAEIRSSLYRRFEKAVFVVEMMPKPWEPNRFKVANVAEAMAAITHLREDINPPAWLGTTYPYAADEIVACANGLLHVGTRKLLDLTPAYFNRVAVPFDYDPSPPAPRKWVEFLDQLWPDDPDSIAALQQFFGYVLSGRTDLHKILLLIGPTRSGKGTIARVLGALVGKGNVAGPTLASLGTNFGLSPLLGRPLAVVSDARLGGANVHQVVERLLSVSGEDTLTVDRKYREPWTGKLPTRFPLLSNELPRFGDASGAIAHRFVVLTMAESFLGRENTRLTAELLEELPGILGWSLDGLDQIVGTDAFTEPASSADAILALQDLVSPVAAFVRDCCQTGIGYEVAVSDLYARWKTWCEDQGHKPGTAQTFGRDLRAVVPRLRVVRPRDGDTRDRYYVGITRSTAHNGADRGPRTIADQRRPACRYVRFPAGGPRWSAVQPIVVCSGATRRMQLMWQPFVAHHPRPRDL